MEIEPSVSVIASSITSNLDDNKKQQQNECKDKKQNDENDVISSASTLTATKEPTIKTEKENEEIKSKYNMRSTRRSVSRSSTTSSISSSSTNSSSSSKSSTTLRAQNRAKLKQHEKEDEENGLNGVKFDLGSLSSESISSASSLISDNQNENTINSSTNNTTSTNTNSNENTNSNVSKKSTTTSTTTSSTATTQRRQQSRKSLQLLNNKSSLNETNLSDLVEEENEIMQSQGGIVQNQPIKKTNSANANKSKNTNLNKKLTKDEEQIIRNNIDENRNENSENLKQINKPNTNSKRLNQKNANKIVNNLDENTLDGFNQPSPPPPPPPPLPEQKQEQEPQESQSKTVTRSTNSRNQNNRNINAIASNLHKKAKKINGISSSSSITITNINTNTTVNNKNSDNPSLISNEEDNTNIEVDIEGESSNSNSNAIINTENVVIPSSVNESSTSSSNSTSVSSFISNTNTKPSKSKFIKKQQHELNDNQNENEKENLIETNNTNNNTNKNIKTDLTTTTTTTPTIITDSSNQNLDTNETNGNLLNDQLGSQSSLSNLVQEPKKKRRRRTSVMVDFNLDNIKNGVHISVSQLFVYKWPLDPEDEEEEETDKKSKNNETSFLQNQQSDETNTPNTQKVKDKNGFSNRNINKIYLSSNMDNLYILQEQISEYLGVKSFKRKYPDIFRRFIDIKEREYLKKNKVVTETQCDLGLTALRLTDCFDLMADDYPDKYKEFNDYFEEKRRRSIAAAAFQAASKRKSELNISSINNSIPATTATKSTSSRTVMSESDRMKELIKKAMKSVASYNSQIQKEKQEDRQMFYDLQTMRIQKPRNYQTNENDKAKICSTKMGQYPVSLLPGQFQYYYKKYTTDELKCLPVNTVIYPVPIPEPLQYIDWKKQQSNPIQPSQTNHVNEVNVTRKISEIKPPVQRGFDTSDDEDEKMDFTPTKASYNSLKAINTTISASASSSALVSDKQPQHQTSSIRITASAAPTVAKLINSTNKTCYICHKSSSVPTNSTNIDNNQLMISCSSCPRFSHPNCLELNPKLVDWTCIRNYDWQCMECKKCSKCNNPHDEDKMMFCDRCDRGFHTYCVGMSQVPTGSWLCKSCTEFNDKLNAIQEKINNSKSSNNSTINNLSNGLDSNHSLNSLTQTPSNKLQLHLKSKLNSTLTVNSPIGSQTMNSTITTPVTTPLSNERRGRGRPPGSLNKPKDPNSPKKQLKINKTPKAKDSPQLINSLAAQTSSINSNSLNQSSLVHNQYEDFNDSLTYENSYENSINSYGYIQYNSNTANITNNTTNSQAYFHLDETSTHSQFQYS